MDYIKNFLKNKRNIVILLAVLIFVLIIVSVRIFLDRRCDVLISDYFDDGKLIKYIENEKYGFMSPTGKGVIEPTYNFATDFHFGYAIVSNEKGKFSFIDEKGKIKNTISKETEDEPCFYTYYGIWQIGNSLYDTSLKTIYDKNVNLEYIGDGYFSFQDNDNKSSGIIDQNGKTTFSWDKDYITVSLSSSSKHSKKYAIISDFENTEKIINLENGKEIFTLDDPDNKYLREEENNIFRIINRSENYKTDKWFYIKDDKIVYELDETIYNLELINPKDTILKIDYGEYDKDKKVIFYNYKTKENINEDDITPYSDIEGTMLDKYSLKIQENEGTYSLKKKNKTILSNSKRIEFLDPNLYEYVYYKAKKNLVLEEKDGKVNLYDIKHDEIVNTFETRTVKTNEFSTFIVATNYDEGGYNKTTYTIYNLITGKYLEVPVSSELELHTNYIIIKRNEKSTYYNSSLEPLN